MNLNPFKRKAESRSLSESDLMDMASALGSFSSSLNVNQSTALTSTAVIACLVVRAETFASLPVHIYKSSTGRRDRVSGHPYSVLMNREWNPMMTSVEGWRWKQLTEDIRGNAYVRYERKPGSHRFWPLTNAGIKQKWDGTRITYEYDGDTVTPKNTYPASEILHFKGPLVKDAWHGTSLVDQARIAIGLTIASPQFFERLITNGNHFPGYLESDNALKKEDVIALAENLKTLAGVDHAGEMRIFDRGLKYKQNDMSVTDADLTAQQLWYMQEICRIFRVPPTLVQDWSRSTYSNTEQAEISFARHTITPIAVNTERVLDRLFTERNERDHYVKFELAGLMRGDYKSRSEGYKALIESRVINPNEARELEDMNPYDGGDDFYVPLNMANPTDVEKIGDDALDGLRAEKVSVVRIRKAQDAERGRDSEQTRAFAAKVMQPLAEAYAALGCDVSLDTLMKEALDG